MSRRQSRVAVLNGAKIENAITGHFVVLSLIEILLQLQDYLRAECKYAEAETNQLSQSQRKLLAVLTSAFSVPLAKHS